MKKPNFGVKLVDRNGVEHYRSDIRAMRLSVDSDTLVVSAERLDEWVRVERLPLSKWAQVTIEVAE